MIGNLAHGDAGYSRGGEEENSAAAVLSNSVTAVANTTMAMMLQPSVILTYIGFAFGSVMLFVWTGLWVIHLIAIIYGKYRMHKYGSKSGGGGGTDFTVAQQQQNLPPQCSAHAWPELQPNVGLRQQQQQQQSMPGVSVIKPLLGVDAHLVHNLESFFLLNYPRDCYELLFCISEPHDPALCIIQALVAKYPHIDASIFVGGSHVGVNPKINNMMPAYNAAKFPLILVSDAGIFMRRDTLNNMVGAMDPKAGVVHQMPFAVDRTELGFAACLEKTYFGTAHARVYLFSDALGINCCTGMSCLYRKHVMDECGGFAAFAKHLAEDFFFAKAFTDRGWKLRLCTEPAWQNSSVCTVKYFRDRLQRWQRLRFAMVPYTIICEPLQENYFVGITAALSAWFMFGISGWVFFAGHTLAWFLLDWILLNIVQNGSIPYSKLEYALAWATREYLAPLSYVGALLQPDIRWKKCVYRLKWGGEAVVIRDANGPCPRPSPSSTTTHDCIVVTTKTRFNSKDAAGAVGIIIPSNNCAAVTNMNAVSCAAAVVAVNRNNYSKMPTSISDYEDDDDDDGYVGAHNYSDDDDDGGGVAVADEEGLLQKGSGTNKKAPRNAPHRGGTPVVVQVSRDTGSSHGRRCEAATTVAEPKSEARFSFPNGNRIATTHATSFTPSVSCSDKLLLNGGGKINAIFNSSSLSRSNSSNNNNNSNKRRTAGHLQQNLICSTTANYSLVQLQPPPPDVSNQKIMLSKTGQQQQYHQATLDQFQKCSSTSTVSFPPAAATAGGHYSNDDNSNSNLTTARAASAAEAATLSSISRKLLLVPVMPVLLSTDNKVSTDAVETSAAAVEDYRDSRMLLDDSVSNSNNSISDAASTNTKRKIPTAKTASSLLLLRNQRHYSNTSAPPLSANSNGSYQPPHRKLPSTSSSSDEIVPDDASDNNSDSSSLSSPAEQDNIMGGSRTSLIFTNNNNNNSGSTSRPSS